MEPMVMKFLQPVRASASRLLAAPSAQPNMDFQQATTPARDFQQTSTPVKDFQQAMIPAGDAGSSLQSVPHPDVAVFPTWNTNMDQHGTMMPHYNMSAMWPVNPAYGNHGWQSDQDSGYFPMMVVAVPVDACSPSSVGYMASPLQMVDVQPVPEWRSQSMAAASQGLSKSSGARRQRKVKKSATSAAGQNNEKEAIGEKELQELRSLVKSTEEVCSKSLESPAGRISKWADVQVEDEATKFVKSNVQRLADLKKAQLTPADRSEDEFDGKSTDVPSNTDINACEEFQRLLESGSLLDAQAPDSTIGAVLQQLDDCENENFRSTLDWVLTAPLPLSFTKSGCRVVQKAMEVGNDDDKQKITESLKGSVLEAVRSPHGNHVLQKCIEVMLPEQLEFVLSELQGEVAFVARHSFGCRILQRLIRHCPPSQSQQLISEVLEETVKLCRHQYGNFVIQHILQHGPPEARHSIAEVLSKDIIRLAKHRIASHVISCAMVHCAQEDIEKLANLVLQDAGQLGDLSRRQYGSFVVREVNRVARSMQR